MKECKSLFTPETKKFGYVQIGRSQLKALFASDCMKHQSAYLLLCVQTNAYFSEGKVLIGEYTYLCHPGEWITSLTSLAALVKMDRRRVGLLLKMLEKFDCLSVSPLGNYKRIILTNYSGKTLAERDSLPEGTLPEADPAQEGFFRTANNLYTSTQNEGEA